MKKIAILLPLLLSMVLLQGCHSSSTNNTSTVRLVNGTSTPLDMYWSGNGSASAVVSAVDYGTASSSVGITAGISSISLAQTGGTPSAGINVSFGAGYSYTMVAYQTYPTGPSTPILQTLPIIDNQTVPVSGNGLIGVADYSGAGSLDVYMGEGASIPTLWKSGISGSTLYFTEPVPNSISQNYHIQITGAGAGYNNDVRLDIPSVTIGNQQILTLVLTPTIGGGLVDGLVVLQQGLVPLAGQNNGVTSYKNGSARVRIAASFIANSGSIASATATGSNISILSSTPLSSGSVSHYVTVPLNGSTPATPLATGVSVVTQPSLASIMINGVASLPSPACATTANTAASGQDLTLLVVNTAALPQYCLLTDDNTLASSGYAKLRLVNGINGIASGISLTYGGVVVQNAQNVALGAASTAASVLIPGGSPNALGVTGGPAFNPISPNLQPGQGVFSLFMLGDTTAVSGVFSSDHSFQGP